MGRLLASPDWEAAPGWLAADEQERPARASASAQWALVLPLVLRLVRRAAHKVTGSLAAVTGWVVVWQVPPAPVAFVA